MKNGNILIQKYPQYREAAMNRDITKEESFFAVFCIESLAEELGIPGNEVL
jgi:hypothetical protein